MDITRTEKSLYNTYLYVSKTIRNKPFRYRKDFDNFDERDAYHLKRISTLLYKYPHIKSEMYFKAPYVIHPDDEHFSLDFYAGMGGVEAYRMYMKYIQELNPDDPEQLEFIKESLKFIGSFCVRQKIALEDYPKHKTGVTYNWMKHLKQHQISVYALMEFSGVNDIIMEAPEDERELFLGETGKYFLGYKTRYLNSILARKLVTEGIKRIQKVVDNK